MLSLLADGYQVLVNYLIDRKFWNLVIKKLKPYHALTVKKGLVKEKYADGTRIKKELVLTLPDKNIKSGFFSKNCVNGYVNLSTLEEYAVEQAMLEVLIETQGMSDKAKYKIGKNKPTFVIDQYEPISTEEKGFVYLIRNDDIYKIGITDNLLRRFNQLKPDEVLNVVRCSNYEKLEKELHKKFKKNRIPQSEYFRLDKNQIEHVNDEMTKGANF